MYTWLLVLDFLSRINKLLKKINTLAATARIPEDIYKALRAIRISLEGEYYSAAPSMQDLVNIALLRLLEDWQDEEEQKKILEALLQYRSIARSRMGKRSSVDDDQSIH